MTEQQFKILLDLYHHYNEAFSTLSNAIQQEFLDILSQRGR